MLNPYQVKANRVAQKYEAVGLEMPKEALELLALRDAAEPLKGVRPLDVREAIASGEITKANVEKRLRAEAVVLSQGQINYAFADTVAEIVDDLVTNAVRRDLDRVIGKLRPRFDDLAQIVIDASKHISVAALADPVQVLDTPEATARFHTLQQALSDLEVIRDLVRLITPRPQFGEQFFRVTTPYDIRDEAPELSSVRIAWRNPNTPQRAHWMSLWALDGIEPHLNDTAQLAATIAWFARRDEFTRAEAEKELRGTRRGAVL